MDDVNDAVREPGLLHKTSQNHAGPRDALAGLQHVGVSKSDGEREHPQRDHGREVERADTSNESEARGHVRRG